MLCFCIDLMLSCRVVIGVCRWCDRLVIVFCSMCSSLLMWLVSWFSDDYGDDYGG